MNKDDLMEFRHEFSNTNLRIALNPWQHVFDKIILLHSEQNSEELDKYTNNGFESAYWFCHASIARDWFRYAEIDPGFKKHQNTKDFLIYNRAWSGTREYRLKFVELLIDHNIVNSCLTSFQPNCDNQHYTNHVFVNQDFSLTRQDLESYLSLNTYDSFASADYVVDDYNSTSIEVVLETLFDDSRWQLTEKVFRPIACGQPFILAATSGSLRYLRSYGFQTFAPWIDETYDDIEDSNDRLKAILAEMNRISNLDAFEKTQLLQSCNAIAEYNKKYFFSQSFLHTLLSELKQNIITAQQRVLQTAVGSVFKKYLNFRKPHMESPSYTVLSNQVLDWLKTRQSKSKI
jgi:hypothetical protein